MTRGSILIVDHNEAVRDALDEILRVMGYRALTAKNGHKALEAAETVAFDVVLVELSR
jgi:CheY-like chemotaxis protein